MSCSILHCPAPQSLQCATLAVQSSLMIGTACRACTLPNPTLTIVSFPQQFLLSGVPWLLHFGSSSCWEWGQIERGTVVDYPCRDRGGTLCVILGAGPAMTGHRLCAASPVELSQTSQRDAWHTDTTAGPLIHSVCCFTNLTNYCSSGPAGRTERLSFARCTSYD